MRKLFITLICVAALSSQSLQAQERWATEFWNPKPLPDDLILPMPCGGAMVFRPVPTPLGQGLLADRPAMLGQADAETNYSEFLRQSFIAGPFRGADAAAPPRYYIGKYEVTRDQYAAVNAEPCPTAAAAGRLPQADIAWHEAIAFTMRYSAWLARNARDALPMRDDARAFVRLPTEDEWEFAARGGSAVAEADFGARVFPMSEGMQRYVWFQGTRSSGGRVRPIGMLESNPLGLFDILGNVAEWVLEPYRLNRVGRPHGQAGGLVARGGDFLTPEDQIRSSLRVELPPLDRNGEALRLRSLGFRPVLALVATSSDQRPAQLRTAFEAEAQSRGNASANPARLLEALKNDTPDPALRQGIDRVGAALQTAQRESNDSDMQAIRSQIHTAAVLGRNIMLATGWTELFVTLARVQAEMVRAQRALAEDQGRIAAVTQAEVQAALRRLQGLTEQNSNTMARIEAALRGRAEEQPARVKELADHYMQTVLDVGRRADRLRITDAGNVVQQEVQAQNIPNLPEMARIATRHMVAVSNGNPPSREQAVADLTAVLRPAAPAPPARR
ncbi:MAG: SUMF1/EgtB/PvdO family nonheme iron enzyme [Roseomonas sp.]|nr:SUMF1/EgtB/PvdO family nonheme iron enzyme [Roseomonas sp.]MCA3316498.1 SUMF1/EgtB/PvdO family nonheme iron enzyme [Roseomonas sp.]MCA3320068.1 SUMF1/EgtB/PvdO family nonheme iron enzyme [Roseomonas sp.]